MRRLTSLVAGLAILVCCSPQPAAGLAQDTPPAGPRWEYKAVAIGADEKEATKKLNELAAEGWEPAGPLGNGLVAFRRPAASTAESAVRKELSRCEGTWEDADGAWMRFKGDHWTSGTPTFGPVGGKVKVVEVRRGVVLVDLLSEEGETQGSVVKAIVRVEGDTLHYCGTFGDVRPTEFKEAEGYANYTLKRLRK